MDWKQRLKTKWEGSNSATDETGMAFNSSAMNELLKDIESLLNEQLEEVAEKLKELDQKLSHKDKDNDWYQKIGNNTALSLATDLVRSFKSKGNSLIEEKLPKCEMCFGEIEPEVVMAHGDKTWYRCPTCGTGNFLNPPNPTNP